MSRGCVVQCNRIPPQVSTLCRRASLGSPGGNYAAGWRNPGFQVRLLAAAPITISFVHSFTKAVRETGLFLFAQI